MPVIAARCRAALPIAALVACAATPVPSFAASPASSPSATPRLSFATPAHAAAAMSAAPLAGGNRDAATASTTAPDAPLPLPAASATVPTPTTAAPAMPAGIQAPTAAAPTPTAATSAAGAALPATPAAATAAGRPASTGLEFLHEFDAYYSSVAVQIPLTDAPVPDGGRLPEREVYTQLFRDSLRPRLLMLEASVYPLPAAGAYFKKHQAGMYEDFNAGTLGSNQLNVLDAVTAGFQEPWALSVFTGSSMRFTDPGKAGVGRNRGYMGYLVSYGAKHIRNNLLIDDTWWEVEWKLKGERQFDDEQLDWSFRVGLKTHGNSDISDVAYLALRRSNLDYDSPWLSLLSNSGIKLLSEFDQRSGRYLRQELVLGRKFPLRRWHIALELEAGVIYEDPAKYRGALVDPNADTLNFVLRPHIIF
jgi:hypothetical protein